jgi:hypothetical protein
VAVESIDHFVGTTVQAGPPPGSVIGQGRCAASLDEYGSDAGERGKLVGPGYVQVAVSYARTLRSRRVLVMAVARLLAAAKECCPPQGTRRAWSNTPRPSEDDGHGRGNVIGRHACGDHDEVRSCLWPSGPATS